MIFLQRAHSATSNERILQRVTSDFLQRAISATIIKRTLQRVTSDFLQWASSVASNERILLRVMSHFATSNEQRVKSYASVEICQKGISEKQSDPSNLLLSFMKKTEDVMIERFISLVKPLPNNKTRTTSLSLIFWVSEIISFPKGHSVY